MRRWWSPAAMVVAGSGFAQEPPRNPLARDPFFGTFSNAQATVSFEGSGEPRLHEKVNLA